MGALQAVSDISEHCSSTRAFQRTNLVLLAKSSPKDQRVPTWRFQPRFLGVGFHAQATAKGASILCGAWNFS